MAVPLNLIYCEWQNAKHLPPTSAGPDGQPAGNGKVNTSEKKDDVKDPAVDKNTEQKGGRVGASILNIKLIVSSSTKGSDKKNYAQSNIQEDLRRLLDSSGNPVDGGTLQDTSKLLKRLNSLDQSFATHSRCSLI